MQHIEYVYACGSEKSEIIIIVVNNSVIKNQGLGHKQQLTMDLIKPCTVTTSLAELIVSGPTALSTVRGVPLVGMVGNNMSYYIFRTIALFDKTMI